MFDLPVAALGDTERSEPPFTCKKNRKPACCVWGWVVRHICKSWEDFACCAFFDKEDFGVDCETDIIRNPAVNEKPTICPA